MSSPLGDAHPQRTAGPTVAAVIAAVAMIFIGWVYSVSGLFMPAWALVGLLVLWVALVWYGVSLARARSYVVLAIPVVAAALWLLTAWLGDTLLGWTA